MKKNKKPYYKNMRQVELENRTEKILELVQSKLPEFYKACQTDADMVILHQDAFAADYQEDELMLLGAAVKYAGIFGKEVRIIGANRETLT